MLKKLNSFVELAQSKSPKTIAVAAAEDAHALKAIKCIIDEGLGKAILIGDRGKITAIAEAIHFDLLQTDILDIPDKAEACKKAVMLVKTAQADILMKGLVDSSIILDAILDKEAGIATSTVVSQLAFIESPRYHKLFAITDAGIDVAPNQQDKAMMIAQSVEVLHRVDITMPKVALIAAVEHPCPDIQATMDAAALSDVVYHDCIVEGPLSVDQAFSKECCEYKNSATRVGGDVDLVVLPDINSANIFYKTVMLLGGAMSASVLTGTAVPVVFACRSDSSRTKYYSLACAISQCKS